MRSGFINSLTKIVPNNKTLDRGRDREIVFIIANQRKPDLNKGTDAAPSCQFSLKAQTYFSI